MYSLTSALTILEGFKRLNREVYSLFNSNAFKIEQKRKRKEKQYKCNWEWRR
jgi:hypothetical protein